MKRVLVTGAGGFIGRSCIDALNRRGFDVHAVTHARREDGSRPSAAAVHRADLLDAASVDALMAAVRPSHLLHFAWIATPGVYWRSPDNDRWLAASMHLLDRFSAQGGRRVVGAGTCAEYDWTRVSICNEALSPLALPQTQTPYVRCKLALAAELARRGAAGEASQAWGRIFFQYGPHEHADRLVASVIRNLLLGCPALCSHGRQVRSFLHVADVGDAFAHLLDSEVQGAVNVGSAVPISLREVVDAIAGRLRRRDLVRMDARPAPPDEPAVLLPDAVRLERETGWRPQWSLQAGVDDAIDWWREALRA
jgi:nucleoside-diphosphate-sugar epimerase